MGRGWFRAGLLCLSMLPGMHAAMAQSDAPAPQAAPFALKTPDGAGFRYPDDAGGKPVVLMFWPAWCPYSRALMPYLQSIHDDYAASGVRVWMLSVREQPEHPPARVMRERGLHLPLLLDADAVMPAYRVEHTPWLVVADAQQAIVYVRPPKPPTPIDTAREIRETLNRLPGVTPVAMPTSWPRPYEAHLTPEQRAPESLFAGQPPAPPPAAVLPAAIPQSEWAPWVESYLAAVGAEETVAGFEPRGTIVSGKVAIGIAREIWTQAYGESAVLAQSPYRAYRMDNRWVVLGSPPGLGLGQGMILVLEHDSGRALRSVRGADAPPPAASP